MITNATGKRMKNNLRTLGAIFASSLTLLLMTEPMAAQIDRTKQPAPGPAPKAVFPKYEEFTLSNGLKVFLVPDERPLVTFRMQVRGGSATDGDMTGLSEATADMLTRGGTNTQSAQDFAQKIDFVGGSINASSADEMISIAASGLKKHLSTILGLFADVVRNPAFAEDEFQKYKNEQITGLKSAKSRPEFLANNAINKVLYGNTPWGQMQTEETVNKLTDAALRKYHSSYFVPNNATLAVVGNFTKDELKQQLEAAFGSWKKGTVPAMPKPKFPELKGRRVVIVDRPASVQSSVRVLAHGPDRRDPERPKLSIMNSIFGGGTGLGNRLAANLREKHAYTYTPYSYFDASSYTGNFLAAADVRNSVTDSAITEILGEMQRIQTEPVPQDELDRNIQSTVGNFLMSIADPTTTAIGVQAIDFYGLPKDYYQRLIPAYQSTTTKDVQRLSQKFLNTNDVAIVVVGKADEVKSTLEKFGKVEVWDADLQPAGSSAAVGSIDGMNADQIWGKMVDAMGGKAKLQAVKGLKTNAKLSGSLGPNPINGSLMQIEVAPNKVHSVLDIGMGKIEQWGNGSKMTVSQMGQVMELQGEDLEKELENAHILPWAYLSEMGAKLSLKGKKDVNGQEAYELEATFPKSGTVTYYVAPKTFTLLREVTADGQVVKTYGEWKGVAEGIKLPVSYTLEPQPGLTLKFTDMAYQINPQVDDKEFTKQ